MDIPVHNGIHTLLRKNSMNSASPNKDSKAVFFLQRQTLRDVQYITTSCASIFAYLCENDADFGTITVTFGGHNTAEIRYNFCQLLARTNRLSLSENSHSNKKFTNVQVQGLQWNQCTWITVKMVTMITIYKCTWITVEPQN